MQERQIHVNHLSHGVGKAAAQTGTSLASACSIPLNLASVRSQIPSTAGWLVLLGIALLAHALLAVSYPQQVWVTPLGACLPLGVVPSHVMDFVPERYYFGEPGYLLAYSDGLIEARNSAGQEFGLPRLMDNLQGGNGLARLSAVQSSFAEFLAGLPHHDDVSMVLASFGDKKLDTGGERRERILVSEPSHGFLALPVNENELWRYALTLGADELKYMNIVPFMMTFVSSIHVLSKSASDIFLILTELFVNALDHGVLGLESPLKVGADGMERYLQERMRRLTALQDGRIEIELVGIRQEAGVTLCVRVKDSGPGFDWQNAREKDCLNVAHGRGIALVQSLCISLQYYGVGNEAVAYYMPRNA